MLTALRFSNNSLLVSPLPPLPQVDLRVYHIIHQTLNKSYLMSCKNLLLLVGLIASITL